MIHAIGELFGLVIAVATFQPAAHQQLS